VSFEGAPSVGSLLSLVPLVAIFAWGQRLPAGAVSLPCVTALTSLVYFYVMPALALAAGDPGFLGLYITSLENTHLVAALYLAGAGVAFGANRRTLAMDPAMTRDDDGAFASLLFRAMWIVAIAGVAILIATGRLNVLGRADYVVAFNEGNARFAFVAQAYTLMIPLTLLALVRERFSGRSLLILAVVLAVFLQVGFRWRIMVLLAAAGTAYALMSGRRIGMVAVTALVLGAMVAANGIGAIRRYGQGVDLSGVGDLTLERLLSSFGGEFGIVYVLNYAADHPLTDWVWFEPWVVGFARLVPTFLWPDKPVALYLTHFTDGMTSPYANQAGIAAPQHVEMLYQFGWLGVPILAFLYFGLASRFAGVLNGLSRDCRIAGWALVPAFFGFYMQTRGYFFQVLADGLFVFGPVMLLSVRSRR